MVTVPATVTLPTTVNIPISSAPSITVGRRQRRSRRGRTQQHAAAGRGSAAARAMSPSVPPDYDARDYRPAITPEQAGAIAAARRNGAATLARRGHRPGQPATRLAARSARLRRQSGRPLRVHQHAQAARGRDHFPRACASSRSPRPARSCPSTASASRSTATEELSRCVRTTRGRGQLSAASFSISGGVSRWMIHSFICRAPSDS